MKKIFGLQRGSKPEKKKEKNLSEREGKCHNMVGLTQRHCEDRARIRDTDSQFHLFLIPVVANICPISTAHLCRRKGSMKTKILI